LSAIGVLLATVVVTVIVTSQFLVSKRLARVEHPDLPGIDVTGLDAERLQLLLIQSKNQQCLCHCGFTLSECRQKDPNCPRSGPILESMVRSYRQDEQSPPKAK